MKPIILNFTQYLFLIAIALNTNAQDFQGKATYVSKSKMDLGTYMQPTHLCWVLIIKKILIAITQIKKL